MKIQVTVREIMDRGAFMKYCELTGTSEWAVNEGQLDSDETVTLTEEQAKEMGFL